ncbi:MAG: chemotaxis protein CheW [Bacteroidales bacterium]|nr:chemotaxis protein CheW [Bacteroidales bacterium]
MAVSSSSSQSRVPYMIYRVGGHKYALPVSSVIEVTLSGKLLPFADTAPYVVGITNYRSIVIPVVDTVKRFSLPSDAGGDKGYTVIIEVETDCGRQVFGALVDKVIFVGEFARDEVKPVDCQQGEPFFDTYIKGVIEQDGEFVLVINPEKIISKEDFSAVSEAVAMRYLTQTESDEA